MAGGSFFSCANWTVLRFTLEARTPLRLGAFAGATLRGGFGHVFKRAVCIWQPGDCGRCLLRHRCVYPYVFETSPPPGSEKLRGLDQVPRPYVLEVPGEARILAPGERFDFRLVLVGRAIGDFPYFLFTYGALGQVGLGAGQGQFEVLEVHAEGPDASVCVYTAAGGLRHGEEERVTAADLTGGSRIGRRLTVELRTPTRIRNDGTVREKLTFQDLVRALLRRLSSLCYFHCGGELDLDFRGLIAQAETVATAAADLRWQSQRRFSERQRQPIDMGGLVGRITFEAAGAEDWTIFLPLLRAGEWVHVGKGCVMGLGQYTVQPE